MTDRQDQDQIDQSSMRTLAELKDTLTSYVPFCCYSLYFSEADVSRRHGEIHEIHAKTAQGKFLLAKHAPLPGHGALPENEAGAKGRGAEVYIQVGRKDATLTDAECECSYLLLSFCTRVCAEAEAEVGRGSAAPCAGRPISLTADVSQMHCGPSIDSIPISPYDPYYWVLVPHTSGCVRMTRRGHGRPIKTKAEVATPYTSAFPRSGAGRAVSILAVSRQL